MAPSAARSAPLVLVTTPADASADDPEPVAFGSYAGVARDGARLLAVELSHRLGGLGAAARPLVRAGAEGFHWGRWFTAAARQARADAVDASVDAIGYAGGGSLALVADGDDGLGALLAPVPGEVVANSRFSADAFVVAGDLDAALSALERCESDNAAPRHLEAAGFAVRDLGSKAWSRFDVDTPLDLALLRLAGRLPRTRRLAAATMRFLEMARLPGDRALEVPHLERIGGVMRDRGAELVVAGRVPSTSWSYVESQTACRVRCLIEERGMRSARAARPRSILASYAARTSPAALVQEMASLGDAVIWDTRVLMAAGAGSANAGAWPPEEERYASDFGDAARIETAWLRELVEAAVDAPVPFLLGGHGLVSDGLRIIVDAAWLGH
jgi:hypothetical protein